MSSEEQRQAELDARLRGLFGGLDTAAGFEARVMQRVAELSARAPRENLRAQFERRRELLRRRLRREALLSGITILGIGACAGVLLWRFAPEIRELPAGSSALMDPGFLVGGTIAVMAAGIWFAVRRARV